MEIPYADCGCLQGIDIVVTTSWEGGKGADEGGMMSGRLEDPTRSRVIVALADSASCAGSP